MQTLMSQTQNHRGSYQTSSSSSFGGSSEISRLTSDWDSKANQGSRNAGQLNNAKYCDHSSGHALYDISACKYAECIRTYLTSLMLSTQNLDSLIRYT